MLSVPCVYDPTPGGRQIATVLDSTGRPGAPTDISAGAGQHGSGSPLGSCQRLQLEAFD